MKVKLDHIPPGRFKEECERKATAMVLWLAKKWGVRC